MRCKTHNINTSLGNNKVSGSQHPAHNLMRETEIMLPGGRPAQTDRTIRVLTGSGRDRLRGSARRTAATRGV